MTTAIKAECREDVLAHVLFLYPYYNTIWQVRIFKKLPEVMLNIGSTELIFNYCSVACANQ
jgi:hypothetical protein